MNTPAASTTGSNKGFNIALWIVQILLAALFGMAGFMKLTAPIADLVAGGMDWAGDVSWLVRFIGLAELAAAIGLIFPAALRIRPSLTPLAAAGLVVVMILAAVFHGVRAEFGAIPMNLLLGALAAFVVWGRYRKVPIAPRG